MNTTIMLMRSNYSKIFHLISRLHSRQSNVRTIVLTKNMTPTLYGDEASPPVRFVLITASLLGVDLKFHKIDLFKGDNKTEFFTKINPIQKVPVLAIGSEVICDSHAIALYLCRKKGTQELYPENDLMKARIDQMMFFHSGLLFPADSSIFSDYFAGKQLLEKSEINKWHRLLDVLEMQLNKDLWLAGNKLSLCDICCATTVSSLQLLVPYHQRHQRILEWMKKLEQLPCFEINARGIHRLNNFVQSSKL